MSTRSARRDGGQRKPGALALLLSLSVFGSVLFVPAPAVAAGDTQVGLSPASTEVDVGNTTSVDVVVESATEGIGSYEFTVEVTAPTASIENVSLRGDPGLSDVDIAGNGSSATVTAAAVGLDATGSVAVANVTVQGGTPGETTLSLSVPTLGNDANDPYNVTGADGVTLTVEGERESTGQSPGGGQQFAGSDTPTPDAGGTVSLRPTDDGVVAVLSGVDAGASVDINVSDVTADGIALRRVIVTFDGGTTGEDELRIGARTTAPTGFPAIDRNSSLGYVVTDPDGGLQGQVSRTVFVIGIRADRATPPVGAAQAWRYDADTDEWRTVPTSTAGNRSVRVETFGLPIVAVTLDRVPSSATPTATPTWTPPRTETGTPQPSPTGSPTDTATPYEVGETTGTSSSGSLLGGFGPVVVVASVVLILLALRRRGVWK